jgi:serine O-acetyltransferase
MSPAPSATATDLHPIVDQLVESYSACGRLHHLARDPLPSREAVAAIVADLCELIYPGFGRRQGLNEGNIAFHVGTLVDGLRTQLATQIARALRHESDCDEPADDRDVRDDADARALELLRRLPGVRRTLEEDVEAAYRGDPAAKSHHEIVFSYPGIEAITVFRLAHVLHGLKVGFIPRMMTELAHSRTGIDIHPGARIGPGFFIDHGTGVVIGETCDIGRRVRLYQGVTLGALSFDRDAMGDMIHGDFKRHPTIQDDVVVYANATILGGKTVIGEGAVIGSNVWLTKSVEPYAVVVLDNPQHKVKGRSRPEQEALMYHI